MMESQDTICAWTEATFGTASSNARVAARANEEMAELLRALTSDDNHPKAIEEAAAAYKNAAVEAWGEFARLS